MTIEKNALIVMAKAPVKGRVKTRLADAIGDNNALALYENFLKDLSISITPHTNYAKFIFFTPTDKAHLLEPFFPPKPLNAEMGEKEGDFIYTPQCDGILGDRLINAFNSVFDAGFSNIVVIGTDSPDIPAVSIDKAFNYLDEDGSKRSVIGPTDDGGYYLLGLNCREDGVFKEITWSSELVFDETAKNMKKYSFSSLILPKWYDIDDKNGLKRLISENTATNSVNFAKEMTPKS